MKKKTTLLKSLLVAAALTMGTSAWAEVTPFSESYSSTSTVAGWKTATSGRFTPVILNEEDNYFLSVVQSSRNNNGTTVTGDVIAGKAAAGDDFTLTFDMRLSSSNNQTATEFKIMDAANSAYILSLKETGKSVTTWSLNGTSTKITLPNSNSGTSDIANVTWCSYKISRSGALTYLTITDKSTDDVIFERATIDGSSSTGGLGNIQFVTSRYNANFAIDNIVVREIEDGDVPAVTPVNYTIKYVNESDENIADAIEVASYVGAEISASADQVEPVYYNGKKYLYKSGNENPITLVNDGNANIIKLVYREAATYKYTVNAVDGESNVLKTLASTSGFEGDELNFAYPVYILNEGKLWNCGATNSSYKKTFNLTSDNQVFTITYAATEIEDVVFYAEAEDVAGITAYRAGNADARSSQAAVGYAAEDVVFTTLPAGKYKLTFVQFKPTSGNGTMTFTVGDNEFSQTTASSNWSSKTFDEFSIIVAEDVVLKAGGGEALGVDFVYIQKTGDIETVKATITHECGFATFCSDKALDFSAVEGLTAYIVTSTEGVATLKKVTKVPAGTGLVLEGEPKTYDVPVIATADAIEGNLLIAATTDHTAVEGDYVLAYKSDVRAFFPAEDDLTIYAGKAYLHIGSGNAPAFLPFAAETTGISTVVVAKQAQNGIFNMAGQRVAQPTKGLYIVNGKKVVLK